MKIADIKVGTEYAEARGDYEYDNGSASRVRVTSTDARVKRGYGYGSKMIRAAAIEYLNSDGSVRATDVVPARRLREEWETYSTRWAEIRASRQRAARAAFSKAGERAKALPALVAALRAAGVPDSTTTVFYDSHKALRHLKDHCPDLLTEEEAYGRTNIILTAPFAVDLPGYVADNDPIRVPFDYLLMLASQR